MVEFSVGDADVVRVAQEVVDTVGAEDVTGDQVGEDLLPGGEDQVPGLLGAERELYTCSGFTGGVNDSQTFFITSLSMKTRERCSWLTPSGRRSSPA